MGKIQDCADKITIVMMNSSGDIITKETNMDDTLDTMLIFLDVEDLYEIVTKKVIPTLHKPTFEKWKNYLDRKLKYWNEIITQD